MKESPSLFSAPMVKAILAVQKTMTRRIVTRHNSTSNVPWANLDWSKPIRVDRMSPDTDQYLHVHFGNEGCTDRVRSRWERGNRLWVKETFCDIRTGGFGAPFAYRADSIRPGTDREDGDSERARKDYGYKWSPSIFMPRHASRITLEILSVRPERLQDITAADVFAEGIDPKQIDALGARPAWVKLWGKINGTYGPKSWDANPWVWRIEFKRVEGAANA